MKPDLLNILTALSVLLTLSCSRSCPESEQQAPLEIQNGAQTSCCEGGCDPSQLVHHAAVAATCDKGGNIEFWECPHCLKAYSDPQGKQAVEGYVYTLPTKFLEDLSPLAALTGTPRTKGGLEAAGLVLSVVSLCVGITSLALSISSLTDSTDELQEAYEELEEQSELTQEELERMERYYKRIEENIDILDESSEQLNASLMEMESSLETLNASLEDIDKTLLELTSSIREIAGDVRADLIIDDRHHMRSLLKQPSTDCYKTLAYFLSHDRDRLYWVDNFKDTLEIFRDLVANQTAVINEWAQSDEDRVADAMTFITTFNSTSYNYKEDIPAFLEQYTNNHIGWEHIGFTFRRCYLIQDLYLMSVGKYLSEMYFALNKDIDKVYAAKRSELMSEQYSVARKHITADSLMMALAYNSRRLCNTNGRKYDVRPHQVSFRDFSEHYAQVEGSNVKFYPGTYNYILYDMPQDSSITREDVELMERFYFGTEKTITDLYFGIGNGGLELLADDPLSDPQLVVPYATDNPVYYQSYKYHQAQVGGDGYYTFNLRGNFHNPFLSSDFLCSTSQEYVMTTYFYGSKSGTTEWTNWPACFTPTYYFDE